MSASIAFSGGTKALTTATGTVSGASNNTAYVVSVAAQGHTQTINVKTDGSGGATFKFVPWVAGTYTVTLTPASQSASATATVNIGGHS